MSRAGKPADNPVNELLNGWIKEELFIDFHLGECRDRESMVEVIERYIQNEIEHKDTFSNRILTEVPKFVQNRMSTFLDCYMHHLSYQKVDTKTCNKIAKVMVKTCIKFKKMYNIY